MAWTKFIKDYYSVDADPLSSWIGRDIVRDNIIALMTQSPASNTCVIPNTSASALSSGSATAFGDLAATMWRSAPFYLRSQASIPVRGLRVDCWARMTTDTGTIQISIEPAFINPPSPVALPGTAAVTSTGAVTTTWGWHTIDIDLTAGNTALTILGSADDGRAALTYRKAHLTIKGRREAGAGSLEIARIVITEIEQ